MTKPDPKLVEQIVEIITHEVLAAMAEEQERSTHPEAFQCKFECADQLCVTMCLDKTGNVVSAGLYFVRLEAGRTIVRRLATLH